MQILKHILRCLLLYCCLLATTANAQVVVEAKLDTANILIGEQVQIRVKCSTNAKQRVEFPHFQPQQELIKGVEVIHNGKTDTLMTNQGKRMELTRRYTITSFDSALYTLPPFSIKVDGKEYRSSGNLGLKVNTVAVDTVHVDKFNGPHAVVEEAFEWAWYPTLLALAAVLALIAYLLLSVRLSDPKLITRRVVIYPPIPAHITAITQIERIKQQSHTDTKAYYMDLTETLRQYLQNRFGFNAKEMTTSEIIDELYANNYEDAITELKEVLLTADLVKFAKHSASMSDQDRSLVQALDYVQNTKLEPKEPPKPRIEYVTLSNKKQIMWRNVMRIASWISGITAVGLLALNAYLFYCNFG